jgi:chemotaxis protein MotB
LTFRHDNINKPDILSHPYDIRDLPLIVECDIELWVKGSQIGGSLMSSKKLGGTIGLAAVLGWSISVLGCCEAEQEKVAEIEWQMTALESRIALLEFVESEAKTCKSNLESAKTELGKLGQQENLIEKRRVTVKKLLNKFKKIIEAGDLSVRVRRGRMVLELPSAVLFQSGEVDLSDKGKETLDSVAQVLDEIRDRKFQVAGHTDNVPVSEDNPYGNNWHLSTARSVQVVMYLKQKGVNPRNLSAAGYAQFQPVWKNKTERGKARNRRIEITLMPNLAELPDLTRLEKTLGLADTTARGEK